MSCACSRVLRSMISIARRAVVGIELAAGEQLRPAEDRVERRPQLVRERREELVLRAVRRLRLEPGLLLALEQLRAAPSLGAVTCASA